MNLKRGLFWLALAGLFYLMIQGRPCDRRRCTDECARAHGCEGT